MLEIQSEDINEVIMITLVLSQCEKGMDCFFQRLTKKEKVCQLQFYSLEKNLNLIWVQKCPVFETGQEIRNKSEVFFQLYKKTFEEIPETNFPERMDFLLLSLHWIAALIPNVKLLLIDERLISDLKREQTENPSMFREETIFQLEKINSYWLDQFYERKKWLFITNQTEKNVLFLLRVFLEGAKRADSVPYELIYGTQFRNIIFYCPGSINCLMSERGSNILSCPLYSGRKDCKVWLLRKKLEDEDTVFYWNCINNFFNQITEKDLIYPKRMELEKEQKNFLSLLFLGIGTYWVKNGFKFPKSWLAVGKIYTNAIENPSTYYQYAVKELTKDSKMLIEWLNNDFQNNLLCEKSQKGIIFLIYLLKRAIEESSKAIPGENPEKVINDLMNYLKNNKN